MTSARRIALWLAMTIATIVVGLMPSAANAHAGHESGVARSLTVVAVERPGTVIEAHVTRLDAASAHSDALHICSGPCCSLGGHAGSCCATGLAPETGTMPLMAEPASRLAMLDGAMPPGIVPEALPEPPRHLA